jgi:2-polyprenyl-3-methyl-5-hydroxy-6-metoxy-1,4-benzoquinol methylase
MHLFERIWGRKEITAPPKNGRLRSSQCTQASLSSAALQAWAAKMYEDRMRMHRKIWEHCFIAQALDERGMLAPGRRGLGFAVGHEPLSELFASLGCNILATDLAPDEAGNWTTTGQHAASLKDLNIRGICDPDLFRERVTFRFVDMRHLPDDLGTYDFIWSSCSLEHLGTLKLGEEFIYESVKYLKPGGVAVHTTEYNLQSNFRTVTKGLNVIFRRRDFERIAHHLRRRGYRIELDFTRGNLPYDHIVDKYPFGQDAHLTLMLGGYVVTSFALIIER